MEPPSPEQWEARRLQEEAQWGVTQATHTGGRIRPGEARAVDTTAGDAQLERLLDSPDAYWAAARAEAKETARMEAVARRQQAKEQAGGYNWLLRRLRGRAR